MQSPSMSLVLCHELCVVRPSPTSRKMACCCAQSSMLCRSATLGVSATGRVSACPVTGQLRWPCSSHRSMYRFSYLRRREGRHQAFSSEPGGHTH